MTFSRRCCCCLPGSKLFLHAFFSSPIAAAITAHGFIGSNIKDLSENQPDEPLIESLRDDAKVVESSLFFVDDFLRNTLDIHASAANAIEMRMAPVDLLKDVLEPVCSILHQRDGHVNVSFDCPENLVVLTDCLRLKQVRCWKLCDLPLLDIDN